MIKEHGCINICTTKTGNISKTESFKEDAKRNNTTEPNTNNMNCNETLSETRQHLHACNKRLLTDNIHICF